MLPSFRSEGQDAAARKPPLDGVSVIDATHVMAGAWCSCLLAQMGAEVWKIEPTGVGEELRRAQSSLDERFRPFDAVNHGKRSLSIDLGRPEGVDVLRRLTATADVFVENYRPGALEARGLGYTELSADHPGLIYCSISAFGTSGPYRDRAGFDLIAQAMSGVMSVTGEAGRPPVSAGVPIADLNAGNLAAMGVLSAYVERLRSGRGQRVDTSLFEAALAFTIWESALYFDLGMVPPRVGARHRLASPYGTFPTADGWLAVAAPTESCWKRLCDVLGRSDLAKEPRYRTSTDRLANRDELEATLGGHFEAETSAVWVERLDAAGVPCGPVLDMEQVWGDPHTEARAMLAEDPSAVGKPRKVIGPPVKMSATPWEARPEAPRQGEHSKDALAGAGYSPEEIERLVAAGVVVTKEVGDG